MRDSLKANLQRYWVAESTNRTIAQIGNYLSQNAPTKLEEFFENETSNYTFKNFIFTRETIRLIQK